MDETRTLLAEIELGEAADSFWKSELGRYVMGRAVADVEAALMELKTVDPGNAGTIRTLQNAIKVAEAVPLWLNELIIGGRQALATLQEGDE